MECEVLVTGTFNLMHAGHVQLLEFASQYGKVTVGVNSDAYLKKKYGDKAIPLQQRAYVLRSCRFVDKVVAFREEDPSALILRAKPKIFVRGPDYAGVELPEQAALDAVGAKLIVHHTTKIASSSQLLGIEKSQWTWGFE